MPRSRFSLADFPFVRVVSSLRVGELRTGIARVDVGPVPDLEDAPSRGCPSVPSRAGVSRDPAPISLSTHAVSEPTRLSFERIEEPLGTSESRG